MKRIGFALLALLGGCTLLPRSVDSPRVDSRYQPVAGRDAAFVAEMRAAPAPEEPDLEAGTTRAGDRMRLAAQGLVLIGSAELHGAQDDAREQALGIARDVQADAVRLYAPDGTLDRWTATFHVRFQLPFGAAFRDLREAERKRLPQGGVRLGTIIGNTPASRANLLDGDYVVRLDGEPVAGRTRFQALLREHQGRQVTLTIVRDKATFERRLRLGVLPDAD